MGLKYVYDNPRPRLTIECTGGAGLGNCYSASYWRVTSCNRQISEDQLRGLNALGLLGFGQEFWVKSKCDGTEEPAGYDEVPCIAHDDFTNEPQPGPAINPYSGKPYPPHKQPYYVYVCEARVDSSD